MVWDGVHPFECPTRVLYGWGAAEHVGEELARLGVRRALIVADAGIERAGLVDKVTERIAARGLHAVRYTGVQPNPTIRNVHDGACAYAEADCDGIVGLGGGSSMDAAKGIGVLATNGGSIADYTGRDRIPRDLPPLICMPTTCGTGAEVTFNAVITDEAQHLKLPFVSRRLAPKVALVDPAFVLTAPSHIIASTAADALAHAIECYINTASDPLIDALVLAATRMIGAHLLAAVERHDRDAVAQLALASTMAGIAFNMNANAIVHAASTPVTARHHVPHGVANAIFLPAGLRFCIPAVPERIAEIGVALGIETAGLEPVAAAERAVAGLERLLRAAGLPSRLSEWGVDVAAMDVQQLAADAMKSRSIPLNPRPVTAADLIALYHEVM